MTLRERLTWAHEPAMACGSDRPCSNCESRIEGARIALKAALERRVLRHVQDSTGVVPVVEIRALLSELEGRP